MLSTIEESAIVPQGLSDVAAGFVHEVKNPLAALHMHLQLLESYIAEVEATGLREKLLAKIRFIKNEMTHLDESMQSLLAFVKQSKDVRFQECRVNAIIIEVIELLGPQAHLQKVNIDFIQGDLPIVNYLDPSFIRQIVMNLILNALQAFGCLKIEQRSNGQIDQTAVAPSTATSTATSTVPSSLAAATADAVAPVSNSPTSQSGSPKRSPRKIEIITRLEEEALVIEVGDNGPGIPEQIQRKIFTPFFSTTNHSGIGLPLIQEMVKSLHGSIQMQSRENEGTQFRLRFEKSRQATGKS